MRVLFLNTRLAERAQRGEGSAAHFNGIATYLAEMGHQVFLPCKDAPHFPLTAGCISSLYPVRARQIDIAYVRMEGHPISTPWFMTNPRLRSLISPRTAVVWEINAAPEFTVYDGHHLSPAKLNELEAILRLQARGVSGAVCNTEGLCRFAEDLNIPLTTHIELATFPDRFTPSNHASEHLEVCWIAGNSRVCWHDVPTVVKAAELLVHNPLVRFHFIGDFTPTESLPNIAYHGKLSHTEFTRLLATMDVGLAIYRPGTWSRYGIFTSPLKIFDYMASGLYIVASPIEQARILREKDAYLTLAPFDDSKALAQILSDLSKDAAFRQRCKFNRELCREAYNWRRAAEETAAFFAQVQERFIAQHTSV